MKQTTFSSGLALVSLMCATAPYAEAQQAPSYGYQQPRYAQPQYQVPPGYSAPQQSIYPQQGYAQPTQPHYVSPAQFLPTFGRRVGSMFRKLFYGDGAPDAYGQPAPQYGYTQPGRGNLDQPPQGYSQSYSRSSPAPQSPYPPRYEVAPVPKSTSTPAMPPTSRINSGTNKSAPIVKKKTTSVPSKSSRRSNDSDSATGRKYTPPSITHDPKPPMIEDQPHEKPILNSEPAKLPGVKPSSNEATTQSATNGAANSGSFLRGKKASKEGRVISPYPPYRELDVSGLSSGSLALDPTTQKVFEVP